MRDPRSPLRRAAALLWLAALTLPACSARNHIQAGAYTGRKAPFSGVQLSIDAAKREVTFTAPGAPPVKRSAQAWDDARWPMLCPRGMKDTSSEVLDLGPEPLQLDATRVEHPLLVADCLGKPIVDLMSLGADGKPDKPEVGEFER